MHLSDIPSYITALIAILAVIFGIYSYFRTPQENSDKRDALMQQQMQWEKDSNNRRFSEMQENIKEALSLAQNHTHTVDTKVDVLTSSVNNIVIEVTKLSTIINERIPKQ